MKDQYFGDINDYRKYGLLRSISHGGDIRLLAAWMLTPDDGSTDGKFISYLKETKKWSKYDQALYHSLKEILVHNQKRQVSLIEETELLPNTEFFTFHVPDSGSERDAWFNSLAEQARCSNFVFLDPDNGLEVKSRPYGRKNSSKYLYWREVSSLWRSGKSLLIYQHFIREKRINFIKRMLGSLSEVTEGSYVEAFSTAHVVFLMALQPKHQRFHNPIVNTVQERWKGQIQSWEPTRAQHLWDPQLSRGKINPLRKKQ